MKIEAVSDLAVAWANRATYYGHDIRGMDDLVNVYNGTLPQEFADYFHPEMRVHVINMVRLAWDDLAALAGKEFLLYVQPDNDTSTAKDRAERQEQIGYGYNAAGRYAGGITMKALMKVVMWWLVGCANAVVMALPSYDKQTPFFTFRDPRTHFPPVGWSPWTQAAADDALFAYQMTVGELQARYPDSQVELSNLARLVFGSGNTSNSRDPSTTLVWVGEYYHEDTWMVATLNGSHDVTLVRSDNGDPGHPGVQPVHAMALYQPEGAKGRSMFSDQVSIQAALARMFSQKLDFYDRTLYPTVFHTPLVGDTVKIGPMAFNEYDLTNGQPPRLDTLQPAHSIDADQTMQFAIGLSRMLNRNPEQMQGAGPANSAKALEELKAGVNDTVREVLWPPAIETLPGLYTSASRMDVNLWANVGKKASGRRKNANFKISYRAGVDLDGREYDFEVKPGIGLGGYQGDLELMQLIGAEMISEDTMLEQASWVERTPQEEKRLIQGDRLTKLIFADFSAKAEQGLLVPGALAKLKKAVAAGKDLYDTIEQMDAAGQLYVNPQQMAGPGGPGGGPGMGPAASFLPMPTLQAMQGGPASFQGGR